MLPPAILLSRWFQQASTRAQFEVRTRIASVTAQIAESVAGMTVIQTFQRESLFRSRFDELNDANRVANTYAQRIVSVFFPSIELLGVLAIIAVLAVGANVLPATQIGTLAAAYFLLSLAFQPLRSLSDVYSQLQSAQAAMAKVSLVLDEQPDIRSPDRPRSIGRLVGELTFERVHFAYGDRAPVSTAARSCAPGPVSVLGHNRRKPALRQAAGERR